MNRSQRFRSTLFAFAVAALMPSVAHASRFFENPNHPAGLRLDWCLNWGTDCGKPAADEFCRRNGYSESIGNAQQPGVGLTRVLQDDRMVCWGQPCDGFQYIVCQ